MHVKEIMTHPVVTCSIDSNLSFVASLMWEHDCGTIPVVDKEGRLAGIVTDRDICMAAYTQGGVLASIPVTTARWCKRWRRSARRVRTLNAA